MPTVPSARGEFARRLSPLGLSLALALTALLLLGRWAGGAAAAGALPAAPNGPSTVGYVVTTTVDLPDNNLGDGQCHISTGDHPCSLRAAVQQLNHDSGGTIVLLSGAYNLTDTAAGDLQFQKNIQLFAAGPATTLIQGNPAGWTHRILRVQSGAAVLLSGVTISGGHPLNNAVGGGIDVVSGTLQLTNVWVLNNQAAQGGGIYNSDILDVQQSLIRGNQAYTDGGGIYNAPFSLNENVTVSFSQIESNTAGDAGGGVFNQGYFTVFTSTVDHNQANFGGGFYNSILGQTGTAWLLIQDSTISQNHSGIGDGGGILNNSDLANTNIINTTVDGNTADHNGGGVAGAGHIGLNNATVSGNAADFDHNGSGDGGGLYSPSGHPFNLDNTLVALNVDSGGQAPDCAADFGSLQGHNLVQSTLGCTLTFGDTTGDVLGLDPRLLPLGNYGGPTATRALRLDSPAIDAGNTDGCSYGHSPVDHDQRGRPRPVDGNGNGVAVCDIGAYELVWLARLLLPLVVR